MTIIIQLKRDDKVLVTCEGDATQPLRFNVPGYGAFVAPNGDKLLGFDYTPVIEGKVKGSPK